MKGKLVQGLRRKRHCQVSGELMFDGVMASSSSFGLRAEDKGTLSGKWGAIV